MMREPAFASLKRPTPAALRGKRVLVLGLGDTGLSAARWIEGEGGKVRVADTRAAPPRTADYRGELHTGAFSSALLEGIDLLCVSPGLPLEQPIVLEAKARNIPVVGDIELFAWHVRGSTRSKVLGVTGTNGKTTVTALAAHLLRAAGVDCESAGNIGPAALAALAARKASPPAVWVLELSSYQLETAWSLAPDAAALLNLSEDHLDRYAGLEDYGAAKARIFMGDGIQVLNRDDRHSIAMIREGAAHMTFGLDAPARVMDFGLRDGHLVQGDTEILPLDELPIRGLHNASNALAACALARSMGVALNALGAGLRTFRGLPHRMELVATRNGVQWYDDSKGTNVGATAAALAGLGRPVFLIAGGDGKGQDFSPLALPVSQFAKKVLLIGRDAPLIERALASSGVPLERQRSLEEAVAAAAREAVAGDAVLLSPACASFDMFRDYKQRGEVFVAAVKRLSA
ncbi:MAG TPA: UDP-N-acetylmuramoyl-L-alanine--D-glutamate ligase [Burkholderiales bacterium]|nr:UDP-N-acetylmuramoyl-L-alanine--D-glutamate ligase [Burkholderiales bacterium]